MPRIPLAIWFLLCLSGNLWAQRFRIPVFEPPPRIEPIFRVPKYEPPPKFESFPKPGSGLGTEPFPGIHPADPLLGESVSDAELLKRFKGLSPETLKYLRINKSFNRDLLEILAEKEKHHDFDSFRTPPTSLFQRKPKTSEFSRWTGFSSLEADSIVVGRNWASSNGELFDFFCHLLGESGPEIQKVADSLKKFGSVVSRDFCLEFIKKEVPSWYVEGKVAPSVKLPTNGDILTVERARLKIRLSQYASDHGLDWPVEVWSNDQRINANAESVSQFPGRIVLQEMSAFKTIRNRFPQAHIVLRNSKDPSKGLASLSVVPSEFKLIFDCPKTLADAARIYGDADLPLTWSHQSKFFETSLSKLGGKLLAEMQPEGAPEDSTIAERVGVLMAKKKETEVFVIVGHCEKGFLVFSDGSRLPVASIKQNSWSGAPIIVMACDTLTHFGDAPGVTYATARSISYDEAIENCKVLKNTVDEKAQIGHGFRTIQMKELDRQHFEPNPTKPVATGQASIQLVDATSVGTVTIHSSESLTASVTVSRWTSDFAKR